MDAIILVLSFALKAMMMLFGIVYTYKRTVIEVFAAHKITKRYMKWLKRNKNK